MVLHYPRIILNSTVCVFLLFSQFKLSFVSVVFDFNDLLNDFAPISLILLTVVVMRIEKSELLMNVICVSSFCLHNSD